MNKYLMYDRSNLGRIGEYTGEKIAEYTHGLRKEIKLHVGDVIAFEKYGRSYIGVVSKKSLCAKDTYGVFGFGSDNFDFNRLTKVLNFHDLTEDMYQKIQQPEGGRRDLFKIVEQDYREMTVEDVEKELGYKIKIKS